MIPGFSEFVPGICCAHDWKEVPGGEYCAKCEAHCQRDEAGRIVLYSRPAPVKSQDQP